jgi:hypothetical protein
MSGEDQPRADRPALDLVAEDQLEHQVGARGHRIDDLLAARIAIVAQDRRFAEFQIRDHLAERAPRRTPANLLCFQQRDIDAGFRQVQRRGEAGEAAADDGGRDVPLPFQRLRRRWWRRAADIDLGWPALIGQRHMHG